MTKVALVTGGTGGIGTAICQKLIKTGYKVFSTYYKKGNHQEAQNWQKQQQDLGYDVDIHYCNVSDFSACNELINSIMDTAGHIDVLVNNAGVTQDRTLKNMQPTDWSEVVMVNLNSVFNCTRAVINNMIKKNYGRIINVSSVNGQKGQFGQANYAASKAGIHGFTKAVALEVAKHNITVNTISPGYIATPMTNKMNHEVLKNIVQQIPVGRLGLPEEVADLVDFLAKDSSGFITGANLAINGGQHMF